MKSESSKQNLIFNLKWIVCAKKDGTIQGTAPSNVLKTIYSFTLSR